MNSRADSVAIILIPTDAKEEALNSILIETRCSTLQSNDPIELLDSDDEASVNRAGIKMETNTIILDAPAASNSR